MTKPFLPENYLSYFNNSTTVLYLESSFNAKINDFIKDNFSLIVSKYLENDINFLYLPVLFESDAYKEILYYNHPYLGTGLKDIPIEDIYNIFIKKYNLQLDGSALVLIESYYPELIGVIEQIEIKTLFPEMFYNFANYILYSKLKYEQESIVNEKNIRFCRREILFSIKDDEPITYFDDLIESEIWEKIRLLKEKGSMKLIGQVIDELQKANNKLSRIFITNDYRIFLKDYGMKEVVMPPLSKCLFFLFLRHPKGIRFKQLSDYHDELLSIYRNISLREHPDDLIESIKAMSDPLNNSVNEKCSRIRAAFVELITEGLAENYYVTGRRGEFKKITLDRSLVEYQ